MNFHGNSNVISTPINFNEYSTGFQGEYAKIM